jgi:hypothetical protein
MPCCATPRRTAAAASASAICRPRARTMSTRPFADPYRLDVISGGPGQGGHRQHRHAAEPAGARSLADGLRLRRRRQWRHHGQRRQRDPEGPRVLRRRLPVVDPGSGRWPGLRHFDPHGDRQPGAAAERPRRPPARRWCCRRAHRRRHRGWLGAGGALAPGRRLRARPASSTPAPTKPAMRACTSASTGRRPAPAAAAGTLQIGNISFRSDAGGTVAPNVDLGSSRIGSIQLQYLDIKFRP